MRDEDLLKDVFRRASHGEPGSGDAFSRFERHERRAALTRVVTVATVAIVSAILLARLLPGISEGPEQEGFIPAGRDLSEPAPSNRYTDHIGKFEVSYPLDWIGRGETGTFAEIFPQVGLQQGDLTAVKTSRKDCKEACGVFGSRFVSEKAQQFFIQIVVLRRGCRDEQPGCSILFDAAEFDRELRRAGAKVARTTDVIAGRRATRIETIFPKNFDLIRREGQTVPPHYWCSGCRTRELLIPWVDEATLYLRVISPDADDLKSFNTQIGLVMDTLKVYRRS